MATNVKGKIKRRTAQYWIKRLRLRPHPEGGYYRETYRSPLIVPRSSLPERYSGKRALGAVAYFLLRGNQFSAFHRLKSDEVWNFYDGSPVSIFIIGKTGRLTIAKLGLNINAGERPQLTIKAGLWFAAALLIHNPKSKIQNSKSYTLVGCTVMPAFEFADFELGDRKTLGRQIPRYRALIERLTLK